MPSSRRDLHMQEPGEGLDQEQGGLLWRQVAPEESGERGEPRTQEPLLRRRGGDDDANGSADAAGAGAARMPVWSRALICVAGFCAALAFCVVLRVGWAGRAAGAGQRGLYDVHGIHVTPDIEDTWRVKWRAPVHSGDVVFLETHNGYYVDERGLGVQGGEVDVQAQATSRAESSAIRIYRAAGTGPIYHGDEVYLELPSGKVIEAFPSGVLARFTRSECEAHVGLEERQNLEIHTARGFGRVLEFDYVYFNTSVGKFLDAQSGDLLNRYPEILESNWQRFTIRNNLTETSTTSTTSTSTSSSTSSTTASTTTTSATSTTSTTTTTSSTSGTTTTTSSTSITSTTTTTTTTMTATTTTKTTTTTTISTTTTTTRTTSTTTTRTVTTTTTRTTTTTTTTTSTTVPDSIRSGYTVRLHTAAGGALQLQGLFLVVQDGTDAKDMQIFVDGLPPGEYVRTGDKVHLGMLGFSNDILMWSSDLPQSARQLVIEGDGVDGKVVRNGDTVHFKASNGLYFEIPDLVVSRVVTPAASRRSVRTAFVMEQRG